uniref:E2 ubiquitin-conjugating enzyme n=2 Tax=Plectus sambesii TaxID=2011161 RepID=A0A914WZI2_9BILA
MLASSNSENLSPQVVKRLTKELADLTANPLEDVKVLVNESDVTDIQAIINGPAGTPYAGGQFVVKLSLSKDFPASPPRGFFLTKVFHPNVASPSGEICVNTLKKDWTPDLGIRHILLTIKCLLIAPNPESALNEEAGRLLMEDYDSYAKRAKMITEVHAMASSSQPDAAERCTDGSVADAKGGPAAASNAQKKARAASKKMLKRL